ncbi:DUF6883 domain-containing protein [Mycolicibacterium setense]
MSPAAAPAALPTRSEIEEWSTSHLSDAASNWGTAATASEGAFDQHRQNISSPGGTTWAGDAKDAALDRVTKDVAVVGRQNSVLREAATLADNGAHDIKAAKGKAVEAITAAENDGFTVGEDLSVTDSREYDINTIAERNRALAEHAEDIRWAAEQLAQADNLVGTRLQSKAAELEGIPFDGEGEGRDGEPTVQLVDNKVQDKPDEPGDKPAEQATGQIGPFAVPKSVEDAAKKSGLKPDEKPPATTGDAGGDLGDLLGANDTPEGKPEDGQAAKPGEEKPAGLPPALSQLPPPPDKAAIDRQAAKVEAARQNLASAQAKLDDAAGQGYTQGAGAGPGRDDTNALSQAVFDARAELTEQTRTLNELNHASAAAGGPTAPVAPLPENADVQAFPKEPPVLERATGAFAEGMKDASETIWDATMPDVGNMYDVATDWDGATPEQKRQAAIDAAGMVPLPGAKILGEGIEHGLDALGSVARHSDEVPTPHVDVDAPAGGHGTADAPAAPVEVPHSVGHVDDTTPEHHGHPDTRAEHHAGGDAAGDSHAVGDHAPHAGDALANASDAVIDPRKFESYSMDPSNVNNGGKWQAWQQIGYDVDTEVGRQSAASHVVAQIQSQLGSTPAEALPATQWGDRFQVNVPISGPSGDGTLVTVWQVENGVPRMITNFLKVWK